MNGGERWCISAHEGAMNGAEQMRNYTARCPDSHLIVMGFSQGGSVQLDVLGGGGGELWGCQQEENPAMDINSAPVVAAAIFGATRRSGNQNFTFGGGEISNGGAPRSTQQNAGLQPYANAGRLREYCQPRDPICAPQTENKDMSFHLDYFDKWGTEAADWVVSKAREADSIKKGVDATSNASNALKKGILRLTLIVFLFTIAISSALFIVKRVLSQKFLRTRYILISNSSITNTLE
ncbi:hypothetical protein HBH47_007130 [Parastagonospora nodorum]|nr:hypothetical protein HBH47_007130 [Parastagonospora nodorum]KAH5022139.1 hypothetical protein HBI77_028410 [Parastagonospora nodorum]